ncbi:hypothetical protein [Actinomycetospora sp.]|jgi:hypothetical protein|uniref:hypothetical protein n=1 Tax=Actinomycetospora sp. TaxID=1872135 RepID=UPI002F3FB63F
MRTAATTTSWVDALARLRPRDGGKASSRKRPVAAAPAPRIAAVPTPGDVPAAPGRRLGAEQACAITGAKRVKKKCCRSTPRCKGCPVVLMRAARAAESGLTGKDLAKAVKRARAA